MKLSYIPQPWQNEGEARATIREAKQVAATATASPCPFCGGEAEINLYWLLNLSAGVSIRCTQCKCSTTKYAIGTMITGKSYTTADRIKQAAAAWNRRQK